MSTTSPLTLRARFACAWRLARVDLRTSYDAPISEQEARALHRAAGIDLALMARGVLRARRAVPISLDDRFDNFLGARREARVFALFTNED
jgi:hypothetical protein